VSGGGEETAAVQWEREIGAWGITSLATHAGGKGRDKKTVQVSSDGSCRKRRAKAGVGTSLGSLLDQIRDIVRIVGCGEKHLFTSNSKEKQGGIGGKRAHKQGLGKREILAVAEVRQTAPTIPTRTR